MIKYFLNKMYILKYSIMEYLINNDYLYYQQRKIANELASSLSLFVYSSETEDIEHISLGHNCSTSWYLKKCGLKKATYPFDWVFTSCELITHCIKDRFNAYLDINHIVNIENANCAGHRLYHKKLFNHKSPTASDENYNYYQRAVERFLEVLDSDKKVVFYITVLNEFKKRSLWINGFEIKFKPQGKQDYSTCCILIDLIREFRCKSKFVIIEQYTNGGKWSANQIATGSSDVFSFSYTSVSSNGGVNFTGLSDDYFYKKILAGAGAQIRNEEVI
jgi:hypothetical protein